MRLLPAYILLAGLSSVLAIPAGSSITPQPPLQPAHLLPHPPDPRRPWTRLRDWVIESLWGINHSNSDPRLPFPPSNVRDRYESDVVLRFHLHNAEEVGALAAASRVLLLDVWAITADHMDIRLADSMVSDEFPILYSSFILILSVLSQLPLTSGHCRNLRFLPCSIYCRRLSVPPTLPSWMI